MKANEIQTGSHYKAKVSGNLVTVRVDSKDYGYYFGRKYVAYNVTNLVTGRKTSFRSAAKFRAAVYKHSDGKFYYSKPPVPIGVSGKPLAMAQPKIDKDGSEYFDGSDII